MEKGKENMLETSTRTTTARFKDSLSHKGDNLDKIKRLEQEIGNVGFNPPRLHALFRDLAFERLQRCQHKMDRCSGNNDKQSEYERLKTESQGHRQSLDLWNRILKRAKDEDDFDGESYLIHFVSSSHGWEEKGRSAVEKREREAQSTFRKQLLEAGRKHPRIDGFYLCPITRQWKHDSEIKAAHVFPHKHGQITMRALFGTSGEMFNTRNGLLLSSIAEKRFDQGFLAIVPNLHRAAEPHDILRWQSTSPRKFKIKVFSPEKKPMQEEIYPDGESGKKWADLDGDEVDLGDQHPRLRYLYYHFLYCLYRQLSDLEDRAKIDFMKEQADQPSWMSQGPYIEHRYLRPFASGFGHEYEFLFKNARNKDGESTRPPVYGIEKVITRQAAFANEETKSISDDSDSDSSDVSLSDHSVDTLEEETIEKSSEEA